MPWIMQTAVKSDFKDGEIGKADFLCYETGIEPNL